MFSVKSTMWKFWFKSRVFLGIYGNRSNTVKLRGLFFQSDSSKQNWYKFELNYSIKKMVVSTSKINVRCNEKLNISVSRSATGIRINLGPVHYTPEKLENADLVLRFGLPSTLIRHENATFREMLFKPDWGILKCRLYVLVWTPEKIF